MTRDSYWFKNLCQKNNYNISDEQLNILVRYVEQLILWNRKINLISRRDVENIWSQHILGSISLLFKFQFQNDSRILDIGTGGGLPGIPLAILNSSSQFTLIDSVRKKTNAVEGILDALELINVSVDCGRAEDLCEDIKYKNKFDYTISRAVASIVEMVKWSKPYLKIDANAMEFIDVQNKRMQAPKGTILLLKGGELMDEINKTQIKLKPKLIQSHQLIIDGIDSTELFDKKLIIIKP